MGRSHDILKAASQGCCRDEDAVIREREYRQWEKEDCGQENGEQQSLGCVAFQMLMERHTYTEV